ncbi:MAG: polysaccharide export protein [Victivallales bacterium]|jgi:polysaccharide export outer membrane protein|nr:polysaccharide export protein [Victivallales bacterium]
MRKLILMIFAGVGLLLTSCMKTSDFLNYPELIETNMAVVEKNALTREEREARLQRLKQLAGQPAPPYTIGAGDILTVKVYDHSDLDVTTPVTPDGYIGMTFVGQIHVAGCTLPEAVKRVEQALEAYIRSPVVGIAPSVIRSQKVTIAGAVGRPGMYEISSDMRLSDLFAMAGGSSTRLFDGQVLDAADFQNSVFVRNNDILDVDFSAAIESGDRWNNIRLQKGDYVYVAVRSESMVTLLGEVIKPHQRIWNKSLGLLELFSAAGGLKESYWKYAIIIRGGIANPVFYRVDIEGMLLGHKPNVMTLPGDIVFVPKDAIDEYNIFIRKLMPTGQLFNLFVTPAMFWTRF